MHQLKRASSFTSQGSTGSSQARLSDSYESSPSANKITNLFQTEQQEDDCVSDDEPSKKRVKIDDISQPHTVLIEKNGTQSEVSIGAATEADMDAIAQWLARQNKEGIEPNFYCNLKHILDYGHNSEYKLLILKEHPSSAPVAFMALSGVFHSQEGDGPCYISIFQVRKDKQSCGYGAALVKHCIEHIDTSHFRLTCEPESSQSFWKKMDFTIYYYSNQSQTRGYYKKEKSFQLDPNSPKFNVQIKFKSGGPRGPSNIVSLQANYDQTRSRYIFEKRASFFDTDSEYRDASVEITVEGELIFSGKLRHAEKQGVHRSCEFFFIDEFYHEQRS